jgi:hypothetical protein
VIIHDEEGREIVVRVRGQKAMSPVGVAFFGELVRAAQAKWRAEEGEEVPDVGWPARDGEA